MAERLKLIAPIMKILDDESTYQSGTQSENKVIFEVSKSSLIKDFKIGVKMLKKEEDSEPK